MKKYAALFPGQGSQSVGMFADFIKNPRVAATFAEANEALGYDLTSVVLNGPEEELNRTEVTQPAILTASVAAFRVLAEKAGAPFAVAGHSLGEYSALVAAGALDFADAVRLVRLRGQAMQDAVPAGKGAMAAVLGLEPEVVIEICQKATENEDAVWAANFNCPGQIVISGTATAVARATPLLSEKGARRVVPLSVSAPSHCPLMESASVKLREALAGISVRDASVPVYCNTFASAITHKSDIIDALVRQLVEPVRWTETIQNLKLEGAELCIECGPGKVLSGLLRKIDRALTCCNVGDEDTLAAAVSAVTEGA